MARPQRLRLEDFAGRPQTLPDGPASWELLAEGEEGSALLLGLGPDGGGPWDGSRNGTAPASVAWLAPPEFLAALPTGPPLRWRQVTPTEALELSQTARVYLYRPGLRLWPRFWLPLYGQLQWQRRGATLSRRTKMVWLPGNDTMLLHRELRWALEQRGYEVCCGLPGRDGEGLTHIWGGRVPSFALAVNFRGLDGGGRVFSLCRAGGVPVAMWLVDNPWNLLSAVETPWWQEGQLFVSDASFVPGLRAHGAQWVHYLPLAASEHMFRSGGAGAGAPLFVGRSAFPARDGYFAHCHLPEEVLTRAVRWVEEGGRPDFFWWEQRCQAPLWPGKGSRLPAYGADICSSRRRALWIEAGVHGGMLVVGDEGWSALIPGLTVHPPVDYYTTLGRLYGEALCCLNVTSLLLPGSLNQRHFDVWAADGFLFTDGTRGLELFPRDLTDAIIIASRADIPGAFDFLRCHGERRRELCQEWRRLLWGRHRYTHRLAEMEAILLD